MDDTPIDPHDIPLEELFPELLPEKREEMRQFLDDYTELALRVFERLERDNELDKILKDRPVKKIVDIIRRAPAGKRDKSDDFTVRFPEGHRSKNLNS
jgi:hypothetical protein